MALPIDTGESSNDVVGGVGDERGMVIGGERAVVHEEIEEMGHLLQVRGNVRVIAGEVNVVELNVDDVLDVSASRAQSATAVGACL